MNLQKKLILLLSVSNRTLMHGRLWKEDGTLAVTVAQEGLVRLQKVDPKREK